MAILRTWSEVMRLATLALSVSSIISSAFGGDAPLGASFIFGDSLVDAGNNNYLSTLSKADIKPNGIDFTASGGRPTGRYTNGRTIGDIVGEELGQPNYALPFLAPNTTGKAILSGVNYASGGGGIMNATGRIFRLYQMDAKKFVIGNVGPIGCIPYQKTINQLQENECVDLANKLALQYNARLKDLLAELNDNLPGAVFVHANVYDLVMELVTNFDKYGFSTATRACCGNGGQFAGIVPCGPTSSMCKDRSKHVFWDPYHPSEAANLIIAKQLLDGDTKYMSPMNLRQLRNH
ncbi:GDSL esterase/lipase At2g23540 [Linum grandiflorum]